MLVYLFLVAAYGRNLIVSWRDGLALAILFFWVFSFTDKKFQPRFDFLFFFNFYWLFMRREREIETFSARWVKESKPKTGIQKLMSLDFDISFLLNCIHLFFPVERSKFEDRRNAGGKAKEEVYFSSRRY